MGLGLGMGWVVRYRRRMLIDVIKRINGYTHICLRGSYTIAVIRVPSAVLFLLFVQMHHTGLSVSERVYGMTIASRVRASANLTRSAFPPLTSQG